MKRLRRGAYPSDDHVLECTGREVYAHASIIGIDEAGSVFQGFDGTIEDHDYRELYEADADKLALAATATASPRQGPRVTLFQPPDPASDPPPFSDLERRELAEEMVTRWKKWGGLNG